MIGASGLARRILQKCHTVFPRTLATFASNFSRAWTILAPIALMLLAYPCAAQRTYEVPKVSPARYDGDVRNLPQVPGPPPHARRNEHEGPPSTKVSQGVTTEAVNIGSTPMPSPIQNFAGLSFADNVTGGRAGAGWPPDANGDVGRNHYIEAVNEAFAIYDKTGVRLAAFTENSLWSGSGNTPCNGNSFGDPIVVYDQFADRWILANLGSVNLTSPFYECIAVSQTNDPVAGGWWLYPLRMDPGGTGLPPVGTLHDYPKFGIWNDGCLYMTANGFGGSFGGFVGSVYASLNRSDMEAGLPITWSLGFLANSSDPFSMLPSNLLGVSAGAMPPPGTPNYFVSQSPGTFAFEVRTFMPGANCGAGGILGSPVNVSESSYTFPIGVPQPNTFTFLDSIDDRLLQKLQYRTVGTAESLWVVHSVRTSGSAPVTQQWAQLDVTGGTIATTPVQQQIYSPDTTLNRWMGSIAADRRGNVALGYSTSNGTAPNYPSIAYSGRLATDPLNNLSQTETVLLTGSGSQIGINRWGDYSSMSVDPTDDCTFWYTNEYYASQSNGNSGNWQTRIGSFRFPSCAPTTPELSIRKTHSGTFSRGQTGATFTITVSNTPNAPTTSGTITVTDTLPSGLALVSMAGTGWSCSVNVCARSDGLAGGASYPAITVTVNVASNASSPQVNSVTVTGGGSPDATTTDTVLPAPRLFVVKSHTGSFTVGQNGVYSVTVSNVQIGSTTNGAVTLTEMLPSGLTLVSMAGTGWACSNNSCTRSDSLNGGSSYEPITVTVAVSTTAPSPQVNSVSATGGGSMTATATDSTNIIPLPPPNDEWINATVVGPLPYSTSEDTTSATANSSDPVVCFLPAKTVWFKYVADFTGMLSVDTAGSMYDTTLVVYQGSVSSASEIGCNDDVDGTLQSRLIFQVTSGQTYYFEVGSFGGPGGMLNLHVFRPSILSITKAHTGGFSAGQTNATYKVVVSNNPSAAPTSGIVTVTDTVQSGLTLVSMAGTGWTCTNNSCTRNDALAAGSSYPAITVTVNIAANVFSVFNSVTVSGGGSAPANAFDFASIVTTGWSISKTHPSFAFIQGQTGATYTVVVSNFTSNPAGGGTITVTDTLPSGLTLVSMAGTGWTCASNSCTRTDGLLPFSSFPPIIVTVNVAANATSPQVNSVSVSGGGLASNTATDSTPILPVGLTIAKTHTGDFAQGQNGAIYTVTVSNPPGAPASSGFASVQEIMPTGLTFVSMAGTGWNCSFKFCSRSDMLPGGSSYPPITVTVNVSPTATSPQVNAVSLSQAGAANSTAFDSTNITSVAPANDEIASATVISSLPASLTENTTLATSNPNDPPQSCSLTPSKPAPRSLQNGHTVWFKYVSTFTGPVRVDTAGSDYDTVLTAYLTSISATTEVACNDDVDGTLQSRVIFPVTSGQTYYFEVASYGSSNGGGLTLHVLNPTVLTISKTHTGNFTQGQNGATYTLSVSNAVGAAPTDGSQVFVSDTLPSGLTFVSMTGTGWNCFFPFCYRFDTLGAGLSYPPITVTVNVSPNSTSPQMNSVSLSGGGSLNASATDSTTVLVPILTITKTHTGNFTAGQVGATYTVTVSNTGTGPTNGTTVTVAETPPSFFTVTSMAGTGWTCSFGTCTRADVLAAGLSYPPITVTVNVSQSATSPLINSVSVSGGGSVNSAVSDSTIITAYTGSFDMAACNVIAGWAADRDRLNQSITVDLYDGATLVMSGIPANLSRPDVGSYLGDNGLHGFSILTPSSLRDGKPHSLTVKFGGTATALSGSPKSLSCLSADYAGSLDLADCNTIAGWAADRTLLNQSITVDIYDGATLVMAGVQANLSRPDVGSFLGDNGLHGFRIPTPASLKDGNPHSLTVKFGGTSTALNGSPKSVSCAAVQYVGNFDLADCNNIAGWAADRNRLNQSITVDIYDGTTLIMAGVPANLSRPDVGSFLGDNGLHGFSIPTPASLKDGNSHLLTVKFGGSAMVVNSSPRSLSCSSVPDVGTFDTASCTTLAGWAADRSRLNQSINVDIYDGATLILSGVPANLSRPDVGAFLGDNGLHGFSLSTPASLKDNSMHSVSAKFGGTTTPLSSSPKSVTCTP